MTFRKTIKSTLVACAGLGVMAAPAAFASTLETVTVEIDTRYLETDWGVEMVYDKLVKKAETACSAYGTRGLHESRMAKDCAAGLLNDFIENAANETLTDYHVKMRT